MFDLQKSCNIFKEDYDTDKDESLSKKKGNTYLRNINAWTQKGIVFTDPTLAQQRMRPESDVSGIMKPPANATANYSALRRFTTTEES